FTAHIASVSRSCRFALYNIRKIRPYLTQYATRSSCLDYCNALLTDLPACVVKPLQMIHNATARLVFNQLKRAHVTPLLLELHWLPVAAQVQVTYACLQSDCWFCSYLLKCSCKGKCYTQDAALVLLTDTDTHTMRANTFSSVCVCVCARVCVCVCGCGCGCGCAQVGG